MNEKLIKELLYNHNAQNAKLVVVEGFKMTGKSYIIDSQDNDDYIKMMGVTDKLGFRDGKYNLRYDNMWIICAVINEMLLNAKDCKGIVKPVLLDRGIVSTMYYQGHDMNIRKYVDNLYIDTLADVGTAIIMIKHESKEDAELKYNNREKREGDSHCQFDSFEQYWCEYKKWEIVTDKMMEGLRDEHIRIIPYINKFQA